jgi:hypothetical protein
METKRMVETWPMADLMLDESAPNPSTCQSLPTGQWLAASVTLQDKVCARLELHRFKMVLQEDHDAMPALQLRKRKAEGSQQLTTCGKKAKKQTAWDRAIGEIKARMNLKRRPMVQSKRDALWKQVHDLDLKIKATQSALNRHEDATIYSENCLLALQWYVHSKRAINLTRCV